MTIGKYYKINKRKDEIMYRFNSANRRKIGSGNVDIAKDQWDMMGDKPAKYKVSWSSGGADNISSLNSYIAMLKKAFALVNKLNRR